MTAHITSYMTMLVTVLAAFLPARAQENLLRIPDVTSRPGRTVNIPVRLENTADIVGVQFDVALPAGVVPVAEPATTESRTGSHVVMMSPVGTDRYRIMLYSPSNIPVTGRSGDILSIPVMTSPDIPEGSSLPLSMTDVTVAAPDGTNILTGFEAGNIEISRSPDLEISNVTFSSSDIAPGESIQFAWQVTNIGGLPTEAGWNEQILVLTPDGRTVSVGSARTETLLAPGESAARAAVVEMPRMIGADGECRIMVRLTPMAGCGEPDSMRDNNSATSAETLEIALATYLNPLAFNMTEGITRNVTFTLGRSGSTLTDEEWTLEADETDERFSWPAQVVIPAGSSAVRVTVTLTPDGRLNDIECFEIRATNPRYGTSEPLAFTVIDDTMPTLRLLSDRDELTEGESLDFTITVDKAPRHDLTVTLTSEYPARFTIPSRAVIPAGETSVRFQGSIESNSIPEATVEAELTASAPGYVTATSLITLIDDDTPALELTLSETGVSEGIGTMGVTGYVTRLSGPDIPLTIELLDDSEGNIHFTSRRITMAAGQTDVHFEFGPVDNLQAEGDRTYTIYAGVLLSGCSCTPAVTSDRGVASATLEVYDNDGPALELSATTTILREGAETRMTVTRNTPTDGPLTVNVTVSDSERLSAPVSVTIPAGQHSGNFTVATLGNSIGDDSTRLFVSVSATGHSKASMSLTVTDSSLPDAVIRNLWMEDAEIRAGRNAEVSITVANIGLMTLPEATEVLLYDPVSTNRVIGAGWLTEALEPGEEATLNISFATDSVPRAYEICARVNPESRIAELNHNNNTSATGYTFRTISPYTAAVEPSSTTYNAGEPVAFAGVAEGMYAENDMIEVYLIHSGLRRSVEVAIGPDGRFSGTIQPQGGVNGDFIFGCCYPGQNSTDSDITISVRGLRRSSPVNYNTHDTHPDIPVTGRLVFTNPCNDYIRGFRVGHVTPDGIRSVLDATSDAIPPHGTVTVDYEYTYDRLTPGADWEISTITAYADGIDPVVTDIYLYSRPQGGALAVDKTALNLTVTHGTSRTVPLTVTNNGGETVGAVTLSAPSWIQTSPAEIPELAPGKSAVIDLTLTPGWGAGESTRTGKLFVNCSNATAIGIPYEIEVVSAANGILDVEVCDNFTFLTEDGPRVPGASLTLRHPATGATMFSGTSDESGKWNIELPEGRYILYASAESHMENNWVITVDPGRTTSVCATIPIQSGVNITYDVTEQEFKDEYEIEAEVKIEMNLPRPDLVITPLDRLNGNDMEYGEARLVRFMIKNVGMMRAEECSFIIPDSGDGWVFEQLSASRPFALDAGASVIIPVLITRAGIPSTAGTPAMQAPARAADVMEACMASFERSYRYWCGKEIIEDHAAYRFALKTCASAQLASALAGGTGMPGSGGSTGGTGVTGPSRPGQSPDVQERQYTEVDAETLYRRSFCNPEMTARLENFANSGMALTPTGAILGPANSALDRAINAEMARRDPDWMPDLAGSDIDMARDLVKTARDLNNMGRNTVSEGGAGGAGGPDWGALAQFAYAAADLAHYAQAPKRADAIGDTPGWVIEFQRESAYMVDELSALADMVTELFGNEAWLNADYDQGLRFADVLAVQVANGFDNMDSDALLAAKPSFVTREMMTDFIDRIRHTVTPGDKSENIIDLPLIIERARTVITNEERAISNGFANAGQQYMEACRKYRAYLDIESNSVCASVTMKFKQTMVMTRQSFLGTLTVDNGHPSAPITEFRFTPVTRDQNGDYSTSHEFQINLESLEGFEGETAFDSPWTLSASSTGVMTARFIPTRYAAPDEMTVWNIGGTVAYIDPYTGLPISVSLNPVEIQVRPTPVLDMDYFVQRDILGDDPLTEEIEPSVESEFSLLITNSGSGEATDINIVTYKPEPVDNLKGVPLDLTLTGSSLNGETASLAIGGNVATEIGNIAPGYAVAAQWWFLSNLMGHSIGYSVSANHVSGNDNPDLSLLGDVNIHELIRSVVTPEGKVAFMANDIPDSNDLPDALYTPGEPMREVSVGNAEISVISDRNYEITLTSNTGEWTYASVKDPAYGTRDIISVTRLSDGRSMPLRNFWQTDRTFIDGREALAENRIHLAVLMDTGTETFRIEMGDRPDTELTVVQFTGIPADGVARTPVTEVGVQFSKPVTADSFGPEDILLTCDGVPLPTDAIRPVPVDDTTFTLDLTPVRTGTGDYTLTVHTRAIEAIDGFAGHNGRTIAWTDISDSGYRVDAAVVPDGSGTVSGMADNLDFGTRVTLTATPAEGYRFLFWKSGDTRLEDGESIDITCTGDMAVTARFAPIECSLEISATDGGEVSSPSGFYPYGSEITLTASADEGYIFTGWIVDGIPVGDTSAALTLTVDGDHSVHALFERVSFTRNMLLYNGWNWVSCDMTDWSSGPDWTIYVSPDSVISGTHVLCPGEMYKVNPGVLTLQTIRGARIDSADGSRDLYPGANWIGSMLIEPTLLDTAYEGVSDGDVIAGQYGFAVRHEGQWLGSIRYLYPDQGYIYYTAAHASIHSAGMGDPTAPEPDMPAGYALAYPAAMQVIAVVDTEEAPQSEYTVEAICGSEPRGEGVEVNDRHMLNIFGNVGDEITFRITHRPSGAVRTSGTVMTLAEKVAGLWLDPVPIKPGDSDGIQNLISDGRPVTVYGIDGTVIMLDARPEELTYLRPGMYIVSGRTLYIR